MSAAAPSPQIASPPFPFLAPVANPATHTVSPSRRRSTPTSQSHSLTCTLTDTHYGSIP